MTCIHLSRHEIERCRRRDRVTPGKVLQVDAVYPLPGKLLSLILVLLLMLQPAAYLIVFKTQQRQIRNVIKERIKSGLTDQDLVLLKIPLTWHSKSGGMFQLLDKRELRYHGAMYDIVRQELHSDIMWYHCISDEGETALFASLDKMVQDDMNQDNGRRQQREKLLHLLSSLFSDDTISLLPVHFTEKKNVTIYSFSLNTWNTTPLTPPPHV